MLHGDKMVKSHLIRERVDWDTKGSGETKIAYLKLSFAIDE